MMLENDHGWITALAHAARTATVSSEAFSLPDPYRGLLVKWNATAGSGHDLDIAVEYYEPAESTWKTWCYQETITNTVSRLMMIYPTNLSSTGAGPEGPNLWFDFAPPRVFRITVTHADATSVTYSVMWMPLS